jgi:hypothetical protein
MSGQFLDPGETTINVPFQADLSITGLKPWWQSKTVLALLVMIILRALARLGIAGPEVSAAVEGGVGDVLTVIVPAVLAIYGRFAVTHRLTLGNVPEPTEYAARAADMPGVTAAVKPASVDVTQVAKTVGLVLLLAILTAIAAVAAGCAAINGSSRPSAEKAIYAARSAFNAADSLYLGLLQAHKLDLPAVERIEDVRKPADAMLTQYENDVRAGVAPTQAMIDSLNAAVAKFLPPHRRPAMETALLLALVQTVPALVEVVQSLRPGSPGPTPAQWDALDAQTRSLNAAIDACVAQLRSQAAAAGASSSASTAAGA